MTWKVRLVLLLIPAVVVAYYHFRPFQPTVHPDGTVMKIVDGDTIDVSGAGRVRILLIDAPETHDNDHARKGCYAYAAKNFLTDLIPPGTHVDLFLDRETHDRYGRLLAYVEADGRDVGRQVVAAGLAKVVYYKPNGARLADYQRVEAEARRSSLGIWSPTCAS